MQFCPGGVTASVCEVKHPTPRQEATTHPPRRWLNVDDAPYNRLPVIVPTLTPLRWD